MSNSLWPHELQHARLPCLSPTPGACSNSCPSSQWCHPTIYLILCRPLLLLPSIFPSIRVFSNESALCIKWPKLMFSFNISPFTEYSGLTFFRTDWFVFLQSKGLSRVLFSTAIKKHQFFSPQVFFMLPSSPAPLFLLPSIFPSIRVSSNESALCIRWPKHWSFSFSFSIGSFNEHSGLISLSID